MIFGKSERQQHSFYQAIQKIAYSRHFLSEHTSPSQLLLHICLAAFVLSKNTSSTTSLDAGKNSFLELRRMRMKFGKSTVTTENILDPDKFVPFWITISRGLYTNFN